MPASTSPEPAVASQGGALSAIAARPSGAATTVSGPLSKTTAPEISAARRARSSFEGDSSARALNKRLNSPSCGVITVALVRLLMALQSVCGSSAKLVSASASSTTARSPLSAAITKSRMGWPTPPPGPSSTTLRRASSRKRASSSAPSTGRTMTARLAAALTASASRGVAMVTSPAPARNAPRAASRAAPVKDSPPETTTAWPRVYLWPSTRGSGKVFAHRGGELIEMRGLIASSTLAAIPMSATRTVPQWSRPGRSTWPTLQRKKVTVSAAFTARPITAPVVPLIPLGRSTAQTQDAGFMASIMARATPSTGRSRPAPNSASMMTSAGINAAGAAAVVGPCQRCAANAASPLSRSRFPTRRMRTRYPRSARMRAATKPSPPLLPGPATTATRRPGG